MNITIESDAMRELMRRLALVNEAEDKPSILNNEPETDNDVPADGDSEATPTEPETGSEDQNKDDTEITDVMTEPRSDRSEKFSVSTLAGDLGIENTDLFKTAFNQLRSGTEPTDQDQIKELAAAFTKLMSTDTSTAQKVVNRLRSIYNRPVKSSA